MKATVRYRLGDARTARVGESWVCCPVDHPGNAVSNTKWVLTSNVVAVNVSSGRVETLNTIYEKLALH